MTAIPHFTYPMQFKGTKFCENEQGSEDDLIACVTAVVLTHPGDREMLPDFGLLDPVFSRQPVDVTAMTNAISVWEPRATAMLEQDPNFLDRLISDVTAHVAGGES